MRAMRIAVLALLAGCASGPPAPDWQSNAQAALKNFEKYYLEGNSRAADAEFARARSALTATGRADLVARAELFRCAAQVASLDINDCPGFEPLSVDATAADRAYGAFIAGRWQGLDANLLPAQQRAVISGNGATLPVSDDPMTGLVAAGALFRAGRISPAGISAATELAAAQGWRRPLLAWLGLEAKRADSAGDAEAAARIRRRIALVSGDAAKP